MVLLISSLNVIEDMRRIGSVCSDENRRSWDRSLGEQEGGQCGACSKLKDDLWIVSGSCEHIEAMEYVLCQDQCGRPDIETKVCVE